MPGDGGARSTGGNCYNEKQGSFGDWLARSLT